MSGKAKDWGPGKPVDEIGLRIVEREMQKLAALVDVVVHGAVPGWGFVILALQFGGGGSSYVTSAQSRDEMIAVARRQGQRLARKEPSPGIEIVEHPEPCSDALTEEACARLAGGVKTLAPMLREAMPDGWGFVLMLYSRASDQIVYVCDAERPEMADALLESADRWEAGEDWPSGSPPPVH